MTEEEPGTQPLRQVMDTLHITIKDWDHQRPRRCWYTGDDRVAEVTYNNQRISVPTFSVKRRRATGKHAFLPFSYAILTITDVL